jgi:anti-sigma regulatory factor (Ser/Thr protein kinase)
MEPEVPTSLVERLPFTSRAPGVAREQVREFAQRLAPATLDDAVLMVSELVTNAVLHGRPEVTLHASLSADCLSVAVGDRGNDPITPQLPTAEDEHGRGLSMVNALAAHWGVTQRDGGTGKHVWFDLATT